MCIFLDPPRFSMASRAYSNNMVYIRYTLFFSMVQTSVQKIDTLNDFFVRRSSYHLKPQECKNLQAFELF